MICPPALCRFDRLPVPALPPPLDVAEARKRREVERQHEGAGVGGVVEESTLACGRTATVLVPDGMPVGMLEMNRMERCV